MGDFFKKHLLLLIAVLIFAFKFHVIQDQIYVVAVICSFIVAYVISVTCSGSEVVNGLIDSSFRLRGELNDQGEKIGQLISDVAKLHEVAAVAGEKNRDLEKQVNDAKQAVSTFQMANTFKRRGE